MGIRSLRGKVAKDIWEKKQSKRLPKALWRRARFLLAVMNTSSKLENLKLKGSPPDIRLHKLKGDRQGQWSLTIARDSGWRIVLTSRVANFSMLN